MISHEDRVHRNRGVMSARRIAALVLLGTGVACGSGSGGEPLGEQRQALSGITISGRVARSNGVGIPGVTVTLSGNRYVLASTDWQGNYAFYGLPSGSYSVRPTKGGCSFSPDVENLNNLNGSTTRDFTASGTGCTSNASAQTYTRKVLSLIFDPEVQTASGAQRLSSYMGWSDPDTLAEDQRSWFQTTSHGRLSHQIVQRTLVDDIPTKEDGFDYTVEELLACYDDVTLCHAPDISDYLEILETYGICDLVNAGTIDEVWMWGAPFFGFAESRLAGPNGFWYNSSPVEGSSCNKLVPIMGYNYERGLPEVIHNYMHRAESTMSRVYGDWQEDRMSHNFDKFGLVAVQSPSFGFSGCGSAHYSPNAVEEYQYDNLTIEDSFCDDFFNYPNLGTPQTMLRQTSCERWNCDELDYYRFWLRHLPAATGTGSDGKFNDWWRYVVDPNAVFLTD